VTNRYDVFISNKDLDSAGQKSADSRLAREVYDYLTARGLLVFFSALSLEKRGVSAYKKAIDSALDSARVLIAVGTSSTHLDSEWVRYEWDSFFNDILSGAKPEGRVFVFSDGIAASDLPRALRQSQAIEVGPGALDRLFNFVSNALGRPLDPPLTGNSPREQGNSWRSDGERSLAIDLSALECSEPKVGVVAVGGGSIRAIGQLKKSQRPEVRLVAANTNSQSLGRCELPTTVHLDGAGKEGTRGDPLRGRAAAEASRRKVVEAIGELDLVVVVACLGGGTGTGAAPVICAIAREVGALTVCFATTPFRVEGSRAAEIASSGELELIGAADCVISLSNEKSLVRGLSLRDSFAGSDHAICTGIRGLADLILSPGLINVDLADLRSAFSYGPIGWLGCGTIDSEGSAVWAARKALSATSLTPLNLREARSAVLTVTVGDGMGLSEVSQCVEEIRSVTSPEAEIVVGAIVDPSLPPLATNVSLIVCTS
jgi:cell division protein FtsZ